MFRKDLLELRQDIADSSPDGVTLYGLDADSFLAIAEDSTAVDLPEWARSQKECVSDVLLKHGAVLLRGFQTCTPSDLLRVAGALFSEVVQYQERAAPRRQLTEGIYTSTEYPADQVIPLHHEMSYSHNWPLKLLFYCVEPAARGGCTPIADDRKVMRLLDHSIKRRFEEKAVMYTRNYGEGVDLGWQEAFQTEDRAAVEDYCRKAGILWEWRSGDRLRTRQVRPATVKHPRSGELVWFNHAHVFHSSNLPPNVREELFEYFKEDELPRNSFYGDGSVIEPAIVEEIRGVYNDAAVRFNWVLGDLLLLDNVLVSHGRDRYSGSRTVWVSLGDLYTAGA
jgi:alpha-ketoglutarate-dependent taurine dioxygenase